MAVGAGREITIHPTAAGARKEHALCHAVRGRVLAIAESGVGLVAAIAADEAVVLFLIEGHSPKEIVPLPAGTFHALAAGGGQAFVAVGRADRPSGFLLQIDIRQRAVVAEQPLALAAVCLTADPTGGRVVVGDPVGRQVISFGTGLRPQPVVVSGGRGEAKSEHPHPRGCCCPCCPPSDRPSTGPGSGGEPPRGGDGPGGREPGLPGSVGVPTDDGGTVVGDGDTVTYYPPGQRPDNPCGRRMFWDVARLSLAGRYVLAQDRTGRHAALLSSDMNLVAEWQFPRGGATVLSHRDTPALLHYRPATGRWERHDLTALRRPGDPIDWMPVDPPEHKEFHGQKAYPLSHGTGMPAQPLKSLVLAVVEGDQAFGSPGLSGYSTYMNRTMAPLVRDYYDENSFGQFKDLQFTIFGAGVGPAGGPLKLPRAKLADYYFPDYVPARVELVRTGVTAATPVVFDGRESLSVTATPTTGGRAGGTLVFPFFALALEKPADFFPVQVKFLGTEKLTLGVKTPAGAAHTLTLSFTAKTIDIADDAAVPAKLTELANYLDGIVQAAEAAAGVTPRLFAAPAAVRTGEIGKAFGRLVVTWKAADTTGTRMTITGATATTPGGDPLGLAAPILGAMTAGAAAGVQRYLDVAARLAQDAAGFIYNARLLAPPAVAFDATAGTLTTTVSISNRDGGPGASVTAPASSGLADLFGTATAQPNSATTANDAHALRDREALYQDAFTAAVDRLEAAGLPLDSLNGFGCALVIPVEPAAPNPADPDAVLPSEAWAVTPLYRPFGFRGAENIITVNDAKRRVVKRPGQPDAAVALACAWALVFTDNGKPDNPLICHELGHAIGYADLYFQTGYRDELAYMGDWAMMDSHWNTPHHCGYHKLQSGWLPEGAGTEVDYGRVFPVRAPDPAVRLEREVLLVPIELWRGSLAASARAAFGVPAAFPVAQLIWLDLGGDGATFGLVEARQPGARFSQSLPGGGGVLVTNGITWHLDDRFASGNFYRRPLQLLNPNDVLRNPGDRFDLAKAPELPVKGTVVEVVDTKVVEGDATVYRVKVTRENAEFIDLYFSDADPYYKNPDLWVDWIGNNPGPGPTQLNPVFPVGQPTDQGEPIRVHPSRAEPHWLVARLRNKGQVKALDVKVNFFYCDPPGAGDRGTNFKLLGQTIVPEVPGGNAPLNVTLRWDVPGGFGGHTCLLVQIEDYRIPQDSTGAALGSDDVWQVNNHAQKNVDKYEALSASPFAPVEFPFGVHNAGVAAETAYLEPVGLPYGMTLTVTPPRQLIPAGRTALFRCRLELDESVIRSGCENDQRFRIVAWRQDAESSARWGGVEYEVRPRAKTETTLGGYWDGPSVQVNGVVKPDPGGGTARVRLDFDSAAAFWVSVPVGAGGSFVWNGAAPAGAGSLEAVAWFDGNRKFGESRSAPRRYNPPPPLH